MVLVRTSAVCTTEDELIIPHLATCNCVHGRALQEARTERANKGIDDT